MQRRLVACASVATKPAGFLMRPRRGGPILAHRSVIRRSLCDGMAHSSFLTLGQNRLRADTFRSAGQAQALAPTCNMGKRNGAKACGDSAENLAWHGQGRFRELVSL